MRSRRIWYLFPEKMLSHFLFWAEIFQPLRKTLQKTTVFHFFCVQRIFGCLFLRKSGFFSDCKPANLSLDWKVFNSFFESAFKMGKTAYSFFLDSSNFFGTWACFVENWLKKLGTFLNTAKQVYRTKIRYFFPEEKFFFQFCKVGVGLLAFEKDFSKKNPQLLFFVCRGHLVFFSQNNLFLFGLWEQMFWRRPKMFRPFS